MSHTPGPWTVDYWNGGLIYPSTSTVKYVFQVFGFVGGKPIGNANQNYDEWEANARLIAAAPDLLETLKVARHYVAIAGEQADSNVYADLARVEAAIAEAEGTEKPAPRRP